jgi:hypothetical protein
MNRIKFYESFSPRLMLSRNIARGFDFDGLNVYGVRPKRPRLRISISKKDTAEGDQSVPTSGASSRWNRRTDNLHGISQRVWFEFKIVMPDPSNGGLDESRTDSDAIAMEGALCHFRFIVEDLHNNERR